MASKFFKYTVGLDVTGADGICRLLKVECSRNPLDNSVTLRAVSGHNLSAFGRRTTVSDEIFSNRPTDSSIDEARWAFALLGYRLAGDAIAN
jgi:hypothetical protein